MDSAQLKLLRAGQVIYVIVMTLSNYSDPTSGRSNCTKSWLYPVKSSYCRMKTEQFNLTGIELEVNSG